MARLLNGGDVEAVAAFFRHVHADVHAFVVDALRRQVAHGVQRLTKGAKPSLAAILPLLRTWLCTRRVAGAAACDSVVIVGGAGAGLLAAKLAAARCMPFGRQTPSCATSARWRSSE